MGKVTTRTPRNICSRQPPLLQNLRNHKLQCLCPHSCKTQDETFGVGKCSPLLQNLRNHELRCFGYRYHRSTQHETIAVGKHHYCRTYATSSCDDWVSSPSQHAPRNIRSRQTPLLQNTHEYDVIIGYCHHHSMHDETFTVRKCSPLLQNLRNHQLR